MPDKTLPSAETLSRPARPRGGKGPLPQNAATTLIDEETLDLSVPEPVPTAHLSLQRSEYSKARYYQNCWLVEPESWLGLTLHLDEQDQMTLTFELYAPEDPSIRYFYQSLAGQGDWRAPLYFSLWSERGSFNAALEGDPLGRDYIKVTTPLVPLGEQQVGENNCSLRYAGTLKPLFVRAVTLKRFRVQRQEQTQWCWAAVTASLLSLLDPNNQTQSEIVQRSLTGDDLNRPQDITAIAKKLGLAVKYTSRQLALCELRDGIKQGLPIPLQINWRMPDGEVGEAGHYVVLTGIGPDVAEENQTLIKIEDPSKGELQMTFAELKNDYPGAANKHLYSSEKSGVWTWTHRIEKKPARKAKAEKHRAPKLKTAEERAAFCQQWVASQPAETDQERLAAVNQELAQLRQLSDQIINQPSISPEMGMQYVGWAEGKEQRLTELFQQQLRLLWVREAMSPKAFLCSAPIPPVLEPPKPRSFFNKKK